MSNYAPLAAQYRIIEVAEIVPQHPKGPQGTGLGVPEEVLQKANVPYDYRHAILEKDYGIIPEEVRAVCAEYVRDWSEVKKHGFHLLLTGAVATSRLRRAAAATVNEIILRHPYDGVQSLWVGQHLLQYLEKKSKSDEVAWGLQRRVQNSPLIVVDSPNYAVGSEVRYTLANIYEARSANGLPIITVLPIHFENEDWRDLERAVGRQVREYLEEKTKGKYITHENDELL